MRHWIIAALVLTITLAAQAEQPDGRLSLTTTKVVIFKDGYSLVLKRAVARTDKQGRVFTEQVPDAAILGSFWATPKEGQLLSTTAGWVESKRSYEKLADCTSSIEVLHANLGKLCSVSLADNKQHSGTIHRVLATRSTGPVPASLATQLGLSKLRAGLRRVISTLQGSRFVLRTQDGDLMLPLNQIRALKIKQMTTQWSRTITESGRLKRLTYRFAKPGVDRELTVMYFRPGLRWIPTYRVTLKPEAGKKTAAMQLQAEILNEAEDLKDTQVDLVVGVPNFRFKSLPSPLILERRLINTLAVAAPRLMQNRAQLSNSLYSQRSSEWRRAARSQPNGTIQLPGNLTAGGKQDLFIYHLKQLTLAKGARTALPIFNASVPYQDLYTWDVHFKQPAYRGRGAQSVSPLKLSKNQTWHQIVLTNATAQPWTTGPAFLMLGQQPLAQELLTYTSPKDQVRVPVTVSVDVRGSYSETETSRKLRVLKFKGYQYAQIFKRGTLNLCNHKNVEIEVEISCRFGGKAETISHDGKATLGAFDRNDWNSYYGHEGVNNHSLVRWTVKLKPGEVIDLTVDYHFYVRH